MLLRRITQHVKEQNWFAVLLDFLIVVAGILIAFQITNWNEELQQGNLEQSYLARMAADIEENIEYLNLQDQRATEIKTVIENFLAALNSGDSSDKDMIEAITRYVSDGSELQDFKVNRTTYDDLESAGNLKILKNKDLVQLIGQLFTDFADHDLDSLVNTDWIMPFESKITIDFDFMRFDQRTQHLFPTKTSADIADHILEHRVLLQRHAALHYWYVDAISDDYRSAVKQAKFVLDSINTELEEF